MAWQGWNMSQVMGSKTHSSPKHPDTIHICTPVTPTALQESTDIFMHRGKRSRCLLFPSTLHLWLDIKEWMQHRW